MERLITSYKIIKCPCPHEYQDSLYGKGNRLHNQMKKIERIGMMGYRCTVCSTPK